MVDSSTGVRCVLFRVSRNSLPALHEGDTNAAFPHIMESARAQLALRLPCVSNEGNGATLVYDEADKEEFQFDRKITLFDNITIPRLPILLLREEGTAEEMSDRMKRIYALKKGSNMLASSTRRAVLWWGVGTLGALRVPYSLCKPGSDIN